MCTKGVDRDSHVCSRKFPEPERHPKTFQPAPQPKKIWQSAYPAACPRALHGGPGICRPRREVVWVPPSKSPLHPWDSPAAGAVAKVCPRPVGREIRGSLCTLPSFFFHFFPPVFGIPPAVGCEAQRRKPRIASCAVISLRPLPLWHTPERSGASILCKAQAAGQGSTEVPRRPSKTRRNTRRRDPAESTETNMGGWGGGVHQLSSGVGYLTATRPCNNHNSQVEVPLTHPTSAPSEGGAESHRRSSLGPPTP